MATVSELRDHKRSIIKAITLSSDFHFADSVFYCGRDFGELVVSQFTGAAPLSIHRWKLSISSKPTLKRRNIILNMIYLKYCQAIFDLTGSEIDGKILDKAQQGIIY